MTTILLTGGAGYIGSHCAKALAKAGFSPVVFDNLSTGYSEFVKWGPFFEGDVREPLKLRQVFEKYQPKAVMHLAAMIEVAKSFSQPDLYDEINVGGTQNLLDAMYISGVDKIVFSSTAGVYGESAVQPIAETSDLAPSNPYSETKRLAERTLEDAYRTKNVIAVVLRYFNAAGASGDAEIGEDHRPESHLIPLLLDTALGRRDEFLVFGDDYSTTDGSAVRDFIHVCDLADAHVAALRHLFKGGNGLTCNLGTGTGCSVLEVIDVAQTVVGRPIPHRIAPRRQGDPDRLVAANNFALKALGWSPQKPQIETIIRDAWRWHQTRFS